MSFANAAQYVVFIAVVTALVRPIGGYLERVFSGAPTAVDRIMLPLERFVDRRTRVDPPRGNDRYRLPVSHPVLEHLPLSAR